MKKDKDRPYSDVNKFPTERLYDLLRRPTKWKDYNSQRKSSAVWAWIFTGLTFILALISLNLAVFSKPSLNLSYVALAVSLFSLISNVLNTEFSRMDQNIRSEIQAEIEYRKFVESNRDIHRQLLDRQLQL